MLTDFDTIAGEPVEHRARKVFVEAFGGVLVPSIAPHRRVQSFEGTRWSSTRQITGGTQSASSYWRKAL